MPFKRSQANARPLCVDGSLSHPVASGNCWWFSKKAWGNIFMKIRLEYRIATGDLWCPWRIQDSRILVTIYSRCSNKNLYILSQSESKFFCYLLSLFHLRLAIYLTDYWLKRHKSHVSHKIYLSSFLSFSLSHSLSFSPLSLLSPLILSHFLSSFPHFSQDEVHRICQKVPPSPWYQHTTGSNQKKQKETRAVRPSLSKQPSPSAISTVEIRK